MTIVTAMKQLCQWVDETVAKGIFLKKPDDDHMTASYDPQWVTPLVFPMFIPPKDKLKGTAFYTVPSIAVELLSGRDGEKGTGQMDIRFEVVTWSPGTYGEEILRPVERESGPAQELWTGEEAESYYKKNVSGWEDHWNVVDRLVMALRETPYIHGLQKDPDGEVSYGQNTEEDQVLSFYPYWVSWVTCSFLYGTEKSGRAFETLLE